MAKSVATIEEQILGYFNDENQPVSARLLMQRLVNSAMSKNGGEKTVAPARTRTRKPRNSATAPASNSL